MSGELAVSTTTGGAIYAVIVDSTGKGGGKYFNNATGQMEAFSGANWANYKTPLTEDAGTGFYRGNMPAVPNGHMYDVVYYSGAGAVSDAKVAGSVFTDAPEGWTPSKAIEV